MFPLCTYYYFQIQHKKIDISSAISSIFSSSSEYSSPDARIMAIAFGVLTIVGLLRRTAGVAGGWRGGGPREQWRLSNRDCETAVPPVDFQDSQK